MLDPFQDLVKFPETPGRGRSRSMPGGGFKPEKKDEIRLTV